MDSRVFRMALLTILSAFILVLVIVYATNSDKINRMFGLKQQKEVSTEASSEEASSEEEVIYGDQIGDSLNAFLLDDDFFDETEKIPSVMVRKKNASSSANEGESIEPESEDLSSEDESSSPDREGTGMAIVGELINPGSEAATDISGYLTSLPDAPPGGYGQYIPPNQTISGTPVGTP